MADKEWQSYEEVAIYLLNEMAGHFGLSNVEGKQEIKGKSTKWEIDAKGIKENSKGFIIIECKRYTTSKVPQSVLGNLAYAIRDTGAKGGIIVSPYDLQKGAAAIAKANKVISIQLSPGSNNKEYLIKFLNKIFAAFSDIVPLSDECTPTLIKG